MADRDNMELWEKDQIEKHGWFIHYVRLPHGLINCHTHGMESKHNHPNLQILCPLPPDAAKEIFWTCVRRIESGERFPLHENVDGIIQGLSVRFIKANECRRPVLRIIFPDRDGNLEKDQIAYPFGKQYTDVDVGENPEDI